MYRTTDPRYCSIKFSVPGGLYFLILTKNLFTGYIWNTEKLEKQA